MAPEHQAFLALLTEGLSSSDTADLVLRSTVGVFSAISGGNKLFVASRHAALCDTLSRLRIPCVGFMQWWVPGWAFVGGIMLTLGLLTTFAASALLVIYLVAFGCEAYSKVESYKPINGCDRVADYLYLPEALYIAMLVAVILGGGGAYSLDRVLFA